MDNTHKRIFVVTLECNQEPDGLQTHEIANRIVDSLQWLGFITGIDVSTDARTGEADECMCPDHRYGYGFGV